MAKTGGYWREAATLIIASGRKRMTALKEVTDKEGRKRHLVPCDYEVLMLKRSSKSKFMPDAHVFPGGIVSEADFSPKWINVLEEYKKPFSDTVTQLQQRRNTADIFKNRTASLSSGVLPAEVALRICAIRECFEESGTLIARKKTDSSKEILQRPMSSADLNSRLWRRRVHKDPEQFLVMCLEHGVVPDIWSLYEWCNWLTPTPMDRVLVEPPVKPLRYDTLFYVCCVDSIPYVRVDQREAVDIQLQSPFALIHGNTTGQIEMRGPQLFELSRLCNFSSLPELRQFLQTRESEGLERWMSVYIRCKDGVIGLHHGDDLYPVDPDYEGTKPKMTYLETLSELRQNCDHFHRAEVAYEDKAETYVLRNVTFNCGQPSPGDLSSVYVSSGKL